MLNNEIERRLAVIVERASDTGGESIIKAIKDLDSLLQGRAEEMDERLIHYLQRRSYSKALDFLRGRPDNL